MGCKINTTHPLKYKYFKARILPVHLGLLTPTLSLLTSPTTSQFGLFDWKYLISLSQQWQRDGGLHGVTFQTPSPWLEATCLDFSAAPPPPFLDMPYTLVDCLGCRLLLDILLSGQQIALTGLISFLTCILVSPNHLAPTRQPYATFPHFSIT